MKCYRETNVKYFYKEIFWGFVVSNSQSPSMKCSRVYTNENIGKEYVGVLLWLRLIQRNVIEAQI